jgi:hypothetical protein
MIAALHITATSALGDQPAAIMALYRDSPPTAQVVMDVHPALGIMHIAHLAAGAGTHRAAAFCDVLGAALGRGSTVDC